MPRQAGASRSPLAAGAILAAEDPAWASTSHIRFCVIAALNPRFGTRSQCDQWFRYSF